MPVAQLSRLGYLQDHTSTVEEVVPESGEEPPNALLWLCRKVFRQDHPRAMRPVGRCHVPNRMRTPLLGCCLHLLLAGVIGPVAVMRYSMNTVMILE